jgi:hypothetical protein
MRNLHAKSRTLVACGVAALAIIGSGAAQAVEITVTNATITAGKLLITGMTDTANANVRLEGRTSAAFNTTSNASKAFTFNFVYHPGDCM